MIHVSIYIYCWVFLILLVPTITPFVNIHGFRPFMYFLNILLCLYLCANNRIPRKIIKNPLIVIYGLLVSYHCLNCYLQEVPLGTLNSYLSFFMGIFSNYCLMIMICSLLYANYQKTLNVMCYAYLLWVILAFLSVSEEEGRVIGQYIHPNQFAQAAGMGLLIMTLTKFISNWDNYKYAIFVTPLIIAIFACGSRNGLGLLAFWGFAFIFGTAIYKKSPVGGGVSLLILGPIALYAAQYIMEHSFVGNRLLTHETSETFYVYTGTVLDLLGDRTIYYVLGYKNFLEHPIFGIGLWHFDSYNNFGYPLHSEYMIHLCEGGIIGAFLYATFIFILTKNLLKNVLRKFSTFDVIILISFLSFLFIGLTAREIYYVQFFPVLSICIIASMKEKISKSHVVVHNYEKGNNILNRCTR